MSNTRVVLLAIGCVLAPQLAATGPQGAAGTSLPHGPAQAQRVERREAYPAERIQTLLDQTGFCQLPPGVHTLDKPLRIKPRQRLTGAGPASTLKYVGAGEWAVIFGDREKHNYAIYLDNLEIVDGGLRLEGFGQHCAIDKVWVRNAPGDGVRIDGKGEGIVLRDVIAWENRGHGFAVSCGRAINTVLFDHCNAQNNQGHGVLLETTAWNATLNQLTLRNCVIQSNGRGGQVRAEVMVRGYVGALRIESTWIESPQDRADAPSVGLRTEARTFERPEGQGPVVRRPGHLVILGNSVISQPPRAIEFVDCYDCRIEQLSISPASARVYWRGDAEAARAGHWNKPGGAHWLLKPEQLVADPELK